MRDLGTLGGSESYAYAVNSSGQIVGESYGSSFSSLHAFVYRGSSMVDLNTLIPPNSGWVLKEATDINDLGQIVGNGYYGGFNRAFLLTPVPEPGSWLIPFGCLQIVLLSPRRRWTTK